jgi:acyl phosphate:glycerol-3-phosphate acyltransferase
MTINLFFSTLIGYLLGNISSAYLYVRHVMHADIRELGSGNAGATNVNRILGLMPALRVFVLDMLKGVAAVLVGNWLAGANGAMSAGLAVVAGHDWPAVMGFRGGKGMATTVGVLLILLPKAVLPIVLLFVLVVAVSRFVSLGSMVVCLAMAPAAALQAEPLGVILFFTALGFMGIFQHRANIVRLLKGSESRLVLTRSTGV